VSTFVQYIYRTAPIAAPLPPVPSSQTPQNPKPQVRSSAWTNKRKQPLLNILFSLPPSLPLSHPPTQIPRIASAITRCRPPHRRQRLSTLQFPVLVDSSWAHHKSRPANDGIIRRELNLQLQLFALDYPAQDLTVDLTRKHSHR